jgi:hypothetical protein
MTTLGDIQAQIKAGRLSAKPSSVPTDPLAAVRRAVKTGQKGTPPVLPPLTGVSAGRLDRLDLAVNALIGIMNPADFASLKAGLSKLPASG